MERFQGAIKFKVFSRKLVINWVDDVPLVHWEYSICCNCNGRLDTGSLSDFCHRCGENEAQPIDSKGNFPAQP